MEAPATQRRTLLDLADSRPLVIAHRGASSEAPGNSLAAFEAAIEAGADAVELDVRQTADGVLVAHHNAARRGTPVASLTYRELVRRSRHRPPTFEEVLRLCAGRVALDVEIKVSGYEEAALDLIEAYAAPQRVAITSFHSAVIDAVRGLRPAFSCGLLMGPGRLRSSRARVEQTLVDVALRCGADFIAPHQLLVGLRPHSALRRSASSPLLEAAAEARLPVAVWTVNGSQRLRHFLAEPRVAAIITDLPAIAVELRAAGSATAPSQV